jgi:predicted AAA+ superfamily ATPase
MRYDRKLFNKVFYYDIMDFSGIVKEQREEMEGLERRERLVAREAYGHAQRYLAHPNAVAIIGPRRCGKSVFSYMLARGGKFGYINFDDERLIGIGTGDLNRVLEAFYQLYGDVDLVVLDEVQEIEGWELFVNRLRRTKRVIVTGSSSRLLAGELATHLTGRYIDVPLHPFSFREYLDLKGVRPSTPYTTLEKATVLNHLKEYMRVGGFPEVEKFGPAILPRIYDDIVTKDIVVRHGVRRTDDLRNMAKYLITNCSNEMSYSKLSNMFGIKHVATVSNWFSYLVQSFLVIKLERFDYKLKRQYQSPKKVYCVDNGIVNAIGFGLSENAGRLMENVVAVELQRMRALKPSLEVYYWRDYQHHEVDFVLKEGPAILSIIQVTRADARGDVHDREVRSLLKASESLRCKELEVITWDHEGEETVDGRHIEFTPLWAWLARSNSKSRAN